MTFGRSPELQKRLDEYRALENAEIERIKSKYPTETVDQKSKRLLDWQARHDFVEFIGKRKASENTEADRMVKTEQDKRRAAMRAAAEFGFKACERGDNMEQMLRDLETLIGE